MFCLIMSFDKTEKKEKKICLMLQKSLLTTQLRKYWQKKRKDEELMIEICLFHAMICVFMPVR